MTRTTSCLAAVAGVGIVLALAVLALSLYSSRPPAQGTLQKAETSDDPQVLLAEANRLSWLFNWPQAGPLYQRAQTLFTQAGDARNALYAQIGFIRSQAETMSFVDISNFLASGLATPLVQNDRELRLWCLAAKGMTDIEIDVSAAKHDWEEVQRLAHLLKEKQWEARAKGELGLIAFLDGDGVKAGRLIGGALLSAIESGDVGAQVRYLELLGNGMNELRRQREALYFFNRATKLAASTKDTGFPFMAYEGKAEALTGLNNPAEARSVLLEALTEASRAQKKGHEAQLLILLGRVCLKTGKVTEAVHYLETAVATAGGLNFYRMQGDALFDLAEIYEDQGDLQTAEARLQAAREASRRVGDRYYLPRDLTALARLKARQGRIQDAEALYDDAEDVIDGLVVREPGPYSRSSLVGEMSETYLEDFELAARVKDVSRALKTLERVRGRTVADALRAGSPNVHVESAAYTRIESAISTLQVELMRSENPDERERLLEDLEEQEQRLAYFNEPAPTRTPPQLLKPVELKTIQASLAPDEIILEYVLDEPQSFCLAVSSRGARVTALGAGRRHIEELTQRYLEQIRALQSASDAGRQLYSILVEPIGERDGKSHWIIVPDGRLYFLPFDSLPDEQGHYVAKSVIVTYVPSASVLEILKGRQPTHQPTRVFLGVGDVAYNTSRSTSVTTMVLRGLYDLAGVHLENLPGTRHEVVAAEEAVGKKGSVLLLGPDATEASFKAQPLGDFSILHLAVHAIPSAQYPTRAALVLGRDAASKEDGLLQEREIARMSLNADLVTLSACDTGLGKLEGEEGVTNLAEAFLFAGAKSVVASLWETEDEYTRALMEQFYRHLAEKQNKDAALQHAKIDLLREYGGRVPPFFWAGFVLVGEGSSPITRP